jgi:mRNA-degrading endonuclease toxin of MazEF toxin-antitoxin module
VRGTGPSMAVIMESMVAEWVVAAGCRVPCRFAGSDGQVVLDQLRTVDRSRLVKRLGQIEHQTMAAVLATLGEMFAP